MDLKQQHNPKPNSNLDYIVDTTFRNVNRLFVLSFKFSRNDPRTIFF